MSVLAISSKLCFENRIDVTMKTLSKSFFLCLAERYSQQHQDLSDVGKAIATFCLSDKYRRKLKISSMIRRMSARERELSRNDASRFKLRSWRYDFFSVLNLLHIIKLAYKIHFLIIFLTSGAPSCRGNPNVHSRLEKASPCPEFRSKISENIVLPD